MINNVHRDNKVKLNLIVDNHWEIRGARQDDLLVDGDTNYIIYMKNVNFKKGNVIEGVFLGEIDESDTLLKVNGSTVTTDGRKFLSDGEQIRTARMVVVNNKKKVIVVIAN